MRKKFKNFITPYVNYTSITNRFLSSFDRFTVFTTVRGKTSKISLIRDFSAQSITPIVFSAHLTVLRLITTVWEKTLKNLLSPWVKCTSITNRVLSSSTVLLLFTTVWAKTSKISNLREFSAQVSQIVLFSAHLTVLRFITTVWGKTSKILFLREFSAQVSQMVFSAPLTVLRFSTTVWGETSKISYLLEFSAQVLQILFSATLTVLRLFTTKWGKT